MTRYILVSLQVFAALCIGIAGYVLGVSQTAARSAYAQSIPIREEAKCIAEQDIGCMRTHWVMRASIVAESASRSVDSWLPASVNSELKSYLTWARSQPSIVLSGQAQ